MTGPRRIMAEFLDVGHVIENADGTRLLVEKVSSKGPGRKVTAKLSDGTSRLYRTTDVVEVW